MEVELEVNKIEEVRDRMSDDTPVKSHPICLQVVSKRWISPCLFRYAPAFFFHLQ